MTTRTSFPLIMLVVLGLALTSAANDQHRHKREMSDLVSRSSDDTRQSLYESVRGSQYTVTYDNRAVLINGQRALLLSGSVHYPRASPSMWPQLMRAARAGGLNTIETYVFWNYHEAERGRLDWKSESRNLGSFLQAAQHEGLFVILRIGPYICAEWFNAGLPLWLTTNTSISLRYYDAGWLEAVEGWVRRVTAYVEPWLARNGGPIIMAQIENEYGSAGSDPGRQAYVQWCTNLTQLVDIAVPWIMCRQPDVPQPLVYAENGFYSDINYVTSQQTQRQQPAMWTENWPGWVENWGNGKPNRPAEDVSYSMLTFVASGGSMHNQYMYYGGTNWGITQGNQGVQSDGVHAITQSYDYDAAIDEFGTPHEPKYSHLAEAQLLLNAYADALLSGPFAPVLDVRDGCQLFIYNTSTTPIAFFANNRADGNCTSDVQGSSFTVGAWSVSIIDLTNSTVLYNSHTLSAATVAAADRYQARISQPLSSWSPTSADTTAWRDTPAPWPSAHVLTQLGPAEQLNTTQYRSQYMWYVTNFTTRSVSESVMLSLSAVADRFQVFVDGSDALVTGGIVRALTNFSLSIPGLPAGMHTLHIRCALIGMDNVNQGQSFHDTKGLLGNVVVNDVDVTSNVWQHVVGLHGEQLRLFDGGRAHWTVYNATDMQRPGGVWLRFAMPAPKVVGNPDTATWQLDMSTMQRGLVYVNGFSIGNYWNIVATSGCGACKYEGGYNPESCRTGCGQPSQSKYHVPRDVLRVQVGQMNQVVVYEEQGGDPLRISFQQRT